jgi:hypothetical protein
MMTRTMDCLVDIEVGRTLKREFSGNSREVG